MLSAMAGIQRGGVLQKQSRAVRMLYKLLTANRVRIGTSGR